MNNKLIKRFESSTPSPDPTPKFPQFSLQKSSTVSNIESVFELSNSTKELEKTNSPNINQQKLFSIEKSRSFSKFKNAFESGVGLFDNFVTCAFTT